MNKVKLSEVATVELSSIDKKFDQNEIPVKLCNFTDVYYNWAITEDIISSCMNGSVKETELNKFTLKKGQVAITKDSETRDDIGMPCYISDSFDNVVLGYHCALITPDNKKLNGKYLNALLNTEYARKCFENQASGSGQRYTLSKEAIESIQIPLPSLDEQKRIGAFFSNIDKKIQNNKRQIEILESIAKTIYDYWFVQFDFPNEEGKPYKSSGGKMVWNEAIKGNIPEHWTLGCLYDIADITMGQSPCGNSYNQESRGELFFQGCSNFGFRFPVENYYTSEPTRIAKENDILMSVRAPVGTLNIALKECCIGRGLAALRHKQNAQSYLYYLLSTFKTRFDILDSSGTTFGALTKDVLFKLKVVIPTPRIVNKFELLAINLDQKIKKLELENRQLCKAKDYILPLIMNDQVSLKLN